MRKGAGKQKHSAGLKMGFWVSAFANASVSGSGHTTLQQEGKSLGGVLQGDKQEAHRAENRELEQQVTLGSSRHLRLRVMVIWGLGHPGQCECRGYHSRRAWQNGSFPHPSFSPQRGCLLFRSRELYSSVPSHPAYPHTSLLLLLLLKNVSSFFLTSLS